MASVTRASKASWRPSGLLLMLALAPCMGRAQEVTGPVEAGAVVTGAAESGKGQAEAEWYGVLDVGEREFRFVLERHAGSDGDQAYQLRSLDEGDATFRLSDWQEAGKLEFELKATAAKYSGELDQTGSTATGTWSQRGANVELVFHKVDQIPQDRPLEVWSGTLKAFVQKLELRFRIYEDANGKKFVRMDSVSQKAGGFKGELSTEGESYIMKVPALKAEFAGQRNAEGNQIEGHWKQGLVSLPLKLDLLAPGDLPKSAAPRRPQTPRAPLPYDVEEVTFENAADRVTLAGTLTIPKDVPRSPAAILISGSGPQDRDETIVDHKPFAVLADHLTRSGFAVLRYDDRGVGKSTGDFAAATTHDFSRDAEAAFEFLAGHPRIQAGAVGLIGHSEGGIVAPMVAARRDDVAWLVLLAGTGINGREILLSQAELVLRAEGVASEEAIKLQRTAQEGLLAAIAELPADAKPQEIVRRASDLVRERLSEAQLDSESVEAALTQGIEQSQGIEQLSSPWFRFFLTYEPSESLAKVRCPVLALSGEKDTQVDPKLNLPAIEKALKHGHNPPFQSAVLPKLNHLFQTSSTGAVSEYQDIEETIAPAMLDMLSQWLQQQAK